MKRYDNYFEDDHGLYYVPDAFGNLWANKASTGESWIAASPSDEARDKGMALVRKHAEKMKEAADAFAREFGLAA